MADELMVDDELVILVDGSVVVLSPVATAALDHLVTDAWITVEDVARHLESTVGLPEEGEEAVRALLAALEDGGLVVAER